MVADNFSEALAYVLVNEGGGTYTNAPNDNGGPTRWGISLVTLSAWRKKLVTPDDVKALGKDEASAIYRTRYWNVLRCADIDNPSVSIAVMDAGVYVGVFSSAKIVQQAANVLTDSVIGPKTLAAINNAAPDVLLRLFCQGLEEYLCGIVRRTPEQKKWLYGWLCRRAKMRAMLP